MEAIMSLRDRKKQRQQTHIQESALELFWQGSYSKTSVEQIAQAAEIAPATFFNYFPTKESVVFSALFDPHLLAWLRQQPTDICFIDALYEVSSTLLGSLPKEAVVVKERCFSLINKTPELRDGLAKIVSVKGIDLLALLIAERSNRPPSDLQVRVLAGSVAGVAIAVLLQSEDCTATHCIEQFCHALTELGPRLREL